MIVTKVKKRPNQSNVIARQPSAETEATTSGIHVSQEDISICAYYMYQKRGSEDGYDA